MAEIDGMTAKLGLVWQATQVEPAAVGMWFAGFNKLLVSKEYPM
jgi:hypothetical protein